MVSVHSSKTLTKTLIEEKMGKSLEEMGTGEKFLNRTAMACAVRSIIDKWDLIKLQSFCKAKDTVNKTKRPPTDNIDVAVLFRNFSPVPKSSRLFPTFSSISFTVSGFMWSYLIHLDLTLVQGDRNGSIHSST